MPRVPASSRSVTTPSKIGLGLNLSIAGIDASLTNTAIVYGLLQDSPNVIQVRTFSASGDTSGKLPNRIARWEEYADSLVSTLRLMGVQQPFLEGYSFASGGKAKALSEFGGIFRLKLLVYFPNAVEVPPSSMKKFITGAGNASKLKVSTTLARKYGVDFSSEDEYDAFGIYLTGRAFLNPELCTNNTERDAIRVLRGEKKDERAKGKRSA